MDYTFGDLITAIKENTEALRALTQSGAPTAASKAESKAEAASKAESKAEAASKAEGITQNAVEAAVLAVKAKHGNEAARKILKDITGSTSIKKIEPQHYEAVIAACEEAEARPIVEKEEPKEDYAALRKQLDDTIAAFIEAADEDSLDDTKAAAKAIIKNTGGAIKKADIPDENLQKTIDAFRDAMGNPDADDDEL